MFTRSLYTINQGYIIDKKAEIHPERIAVTDRDKRTSYSYSELRDRSNLFAQYLLDQGMEKGNTVSSLMKNRIESFDLMFACAKIGGIFVPLNFRLSSKELNQILSRTESPIVFYDDTFRDKIQGIDQRDRKVIDIDTVEIDKKVLRKRLYHKYGGAENPFVLIYTSGSSGEPKGAIQTHLNAFFKSVDSIVDFGMTFNDVVLVTAPLFHVAGLNALTLAGLHVGGRLVLHGRFDAEEALEIIEDEGVSCFAVVPTILRMMANASSFPRRRLQSLRFVAVGGEPLEPELQQVFLEKGVEILNVFGLSETTDGAIYQRRGRPPIRACVGNAATHVDVKLMSDDFKEALEGEVGEIVVGGPTVSPGYWKDQKKTEETFKDGCVWTGDVAYKDAEGYFYVVGRQDDMIKSGAEKISPAEIEEIICSIPKVADAVVIGIPDNKWGQVPKAIVARKKGMELTEEEVIAVCKKELASYKKPKSVVILDELPCSGSGKIDLALIKKLYGNSPQ